MRHTTHLLTNCRVYLRMVVAVNVAPHAARAINVRSAVDVDESTTLGALDHERLVIRHLRKGMPMMLAIPIANFVASSFVVHPTPATLPRDTDGRANRHTQHRRGVFVHDCKFQPIGRTNMSHERHWRLIAKCRKDANRLMLIAAYNYGIAGGY